MTDSLPATAVVRVGIWNFDPGLSAEAEAILRKQADYLVPAIKQLPGLLHWYTCLSDGSQAAVSVWDTEEHAKQMDTLKEMVVVARGELEAVAGPFTGKFVNYPILYTI